MNINTDYGMIKDILNKASIGMWAIELDEGSEPRMYADETMRRLLGVEGKLTAQELYHAWYDNIHPDYYDAVAVGVEKMTSGAHAEIQYPWMRHGEITYTRCGGVRNMSYTAGIRLEGCHQDITDLIHVRKQVDEIMADKAREEEENQRNSSIVKLLASEYSSVYYVDLDKDEFIAYGINEYVEESIGSEISHGIGFVKVMKLYMERLVVDEDKEKFSRFTDTGFIIKQLSTRKSVSYEYRSNGKNGIRYCEVKYVRAGEDSVPNTFIMAFSIVDDEHIKELEDKRREELIHCLTDDYDAVYHVNPLDGTIDVVRSSQFFLNMFDRVLGTYNYQDYIETVAESVFVDDREDFVRELQLESIGKHFENEYFFYHSYRIVKDDKELYYQLKFIHGDSWNKDNGFIIGVHNMDKKTREEIAHRKALDAALSQAEAANVAKTTFLFNMSHDIRTPMNAIIGYTDIAKKHVQDTEKVSDCLNKVKKSSEHLLSLINDVLDMSRIESGAIVINEELMDLRTSFRDLWNMVFNLAEEKNISLSMDVDSKVKHHNVYADELRLNRILINLINNSIKYTAKGGKVTCMVEELAVEGDSCNYSFTIEDNGMGMSEEFLKHVYEPFAREQNSTVSGINGTGLGLSITKELVGKMGGTIDISSKSGVGTKVVVTLPLRYEMENMDVIDMKRVYNLDNIRGLRILVAEDNDMNREIAVDVLEDYGITPIEAVNGAVAVEKYRESLDTGEYYDAVLMDIQMPVMDGYTAASAIREIEREKDTNIHTPIIAMTANAFAEDRERAFAAGMDEHLSKPIEPELVLRTISALVIKKSKEQA